jgi:hypothetical protein
MLVESTDPSRPTVGRRAALRTGLLAAAGLGGLAACGSDDAGASAATATATATSTGGPGATAHTATRLAIPTGLSFAATVSRFEQAIPPLPAAQLAATLHTKTFADVKALLAAASPVSLFIFYELDATPFMKAAGHSAAAKTYLVGNPLIAETMYGNDAGVMLYAPLRTTIRTDHAGATHLLIDRPSDLFGSFGDSQVAAVGRTLDSKIADLLRHLQFPVPPELTA